MSKAEDKFMNFLINEIRGENYRPISEGVYDEDNLTKFDSYSAPGISDILGWRGENGTPLETKLKSKDLDDIIDDISKQGGPQEQNPVMESDDFDWDEEFSLFESLENTAHDDLYLFQEEDESADDDADFVASDDDEDDSDDDDDAAEDEDDDESLDFSDDEGEFDMDDEDGDDNSNEDGETVDDDDDVPEVVVKESKKSKQTNKVLKESAKQKPAPKKKAPVAPLNLLEDREEDLSMLTTLLEEIDQMNDDLEDAVSGDEYNDETTDDNSDEDPNFDSELVGDEDEDLGIDLEDDEPMIGDEEELDDTSDLELDDLSDEPSSDEDDSIIDLDDEDMYDDEDQHM